MGLWGLGGGQWHLQPGHPWETSQGTSVLGASAAALAHAVMKRREEARTNPGQGCGEDVPAPRVTARRYRAPVKGEN